MLDNLNSVCPLNPLPLNNAATSVSLSASGGELLGAQNFSAQDFSHLYCEPNNEIQENLNNIQKGFEQKMNNIGYFVGSAFNTLTQSLAPNEPTESELFEKFYMQSLDSMIEKLGGINEDEIRLALFDIFLSPLQELFSQNRLSQKETSHIASILSNKIGPIKDPKRRKEMIPSFLSRWITSKKHLHAELTLLNAALRDFTRY